MRGTRWFGGTGVRGVKLLLEKLLHPRCCPSRGCLDLELEFLTDLSGRIVVDLHRGFECSTASLFNAKKPTSQGLICQQNALWQQNGGKQTTGLWIQSLETQIVFFNHLCMEDQAKTNCLLFCVDFVALFP